jgi:hypothetical protein
LITPVTLKGLAAGLSIEGQGKVRWMVPAVDGTLHFLELSEEDTPGAHQRLLSWQSYIQGFFGSKLQPTVELSLTIFVSVEVEYQTLLSLSQPTITFLSAMDTMKWMSIAVLKSLTSVLPIPTIKI